MIGRAITGRAMAMLLLAIGMLAGASPLRAAELSPAQSDYVEHCGGCHGIQGRSAPADVPELRDRVGYFMCTPAGRDYLIQLPNVALVPIDDNEELAELMNFVVFGLGGDSTPPGAKPFTSDEVAALRRQPLSRASLVKTRADIVKGMVRHCNAPDSMRFFYKGAPKEPG